MRRSTVHKNQGFTLLEILVALAIAGILAALTGPNLLAWLNRNKVQEATDSIQSALRDAQRQAIRLGRICTINFTEGTGANPTVYEQIKANEPGCLVATNTNGGSLSLPQEVFMVTNFPIQGDSPGVQFSFRGHVPGLTFEPRANQAIIVLYPAANADEPYPNQERKCIVIASLLGIVKQGTYNGNPLGTLDANNCQIRLDGTEP
ncbi:prepilin-type N-terminal cleavage/methylation domain-containing protein [Microcystis aeruginosa CS-558/01A06]|uniref:Prepilin-type N-terminal cleavage/methylation domain-containing protein n=1 Tax=Microcystis aeruginosa BLCC-F108 TaxID=2755317 RepID=A0A841UTG1_MICAE|nr:MULTISPECIES: prepilin-type N-terminal cleavage/methylation domain-containing protein [Microcystis]MBC1192204.1 prepilin-type N-terminal cleavage/methylation domain-containing protein [Microcystis aeruginosa BLCC-F108]MCA2590810.1 prepilin-type N-terminal cleavage/methylation domain-containing protein [Microcystis sp. M31BS1]MDB9409643.1 prepilin-type N-terminal cleavage/methylation domain-containing protein [Microcystis aeruginosa CS-558/01A06]